MAAQFRQRFRQEYSQPSSAARTSCSTPTESISGAIEMASGSTGTAQDSGSDSSSRKIVSESTNSTDRSMATRFLANSRKLSSASVDEELAAGVLMARQFMAKSRRPSSGSSASDVGNPRVPEQSQRRSPSYGNDSRQREQSSQSDSDSNSSTGALAARFRQQLRPSVSNTAGSGGHQDPHISQSSDISDGYKEPTEERAPAHDSDSSTGELAARFRKQRERSKQSSADSDSSTGVLAAQFRKQLKTSINNAAGSDGRPDPHISESSDSSESYEEPPEERAPTPIAAPGPVRRNLVLPGG